MSDYLVELGADKRARKIIKKLGLPIPLPQKLRRTSAPWEERPLHDLAVVVGQGANAGLGAVLARTLVHAGANVHVVGEAQDLTPYQGEGEAWARPPVLHAPGDAWLDVTPHALLFDATGMKGPEDLEAIYAFFHTLIKGIGRCGRIVVLARPPEAANDPLAAAANRAVEGFVRCVSREIGKKGATAQTVYVDPDADGRLMPVLRFLLSARSAYVTGQPLHVSARVAFEGAPPLTRPLEGKVALVTGAAQGIGRKTAKALAREGAHVICMDLRSQDAPASILVNEIGGTLLLCDLAREEAPERVVKLVQERFGGLDILVHNAGVTRDKTLGNMDEERWNQVLGVNLISLIRLNDALLPHIRKDGRIVCLSSIAGIAGNMGQSNYSASKAGVIGYVRALAPALTERGISLNAVAPGFIETRMTAAIPPATREVARRLSNLTQGGLPEDVAEVITFLVSPGAAAMSGEILRICGGNYVGA